MNSMASAIIPKSDQLNSDDLIAGPLTITITGVTIRGGQEQPVAISYEGDGGKPYKSCKSMNRVLVTAWGPDATKYVGRSLTLYRDPEVKWGGMAVGGIRISHMSHIPEALTMALTATKGSRKPFTVRPLKSSAPPVTAATLPAAESSNSPDGVEPNADELIARGEKEAEWGTEAYANWWKSLSKEDRKAIGNIQHERLKAIAAEAPE